MAPWAAEADVLADMSFPPAHRLKQHSTNPNDRLNGEIKLHTDVVGIFPNEGTFTRQVGALLLEQNDEWTVQRAPYMTLETITPLSDDPMVEPPTVAACSNRPTVPESAMTPPLLHYASGHDQMRPRTQYTKSGNASIAYQVSGSGPIDLVYAQGWITNVEYAWESPDYAQFMTRFGSFSRFIRFDRRGMGLSDRDITSLTLDERVDDIRAVLDAVGSERAALLGVSEGGYMSVMFAATHPERTTALVLFGAYARTKWAPDYPWGTTDEENEKGVQGLEKEWGGPFSLETGAPSVANDEAARSWFGAYQRYSASLSVAKALAYQRLAVDIRDLLPAVRVPTLVLHRTGDLWHKLAEGRYLAEHIPGAKMVELPGSDHLPWWGDQERLTGEIQQFLTGGRTIPSTDRVLLTVLVTDIVGSTAKAAAMGDQKWKDLLELHDAAVRREVRNFDGQEINTTGDGFILAFTGPTRAIQCAQAIMRNLEPLGLDIRAGLHTGECERRGNDVGGIAVHVASRILDRAKSKTTWASSTVKDLVVGSGIAFVDEGTETLKGLPGTWSLFSVSS